MEVYNLKISEIENQFQTLQNRLTTEQQINRRLFDWIDEGIFFLDSELRIQDNYSSKMEKLLGQKALAGKSITELFENRIPEKLINETVDYLTFMFQKDLDEETISELNQLEEVEYHHQGRLGLWSASVFLSFKFHRIYENNEIQFLIGIVKDISFIKS
ncbi:MAG: hypothetical protein GF313_11090, partial [Caldithrix sp.]|nr:hypothetical protein [Caldithrix sp.]